MGISDARLNPFKRVFDEQMLLQARDAMQHWNEEFVRQMLVQPAFLAPPQVVCIQAEPPMRKPEPKVKAAAVKPKPIEVLQLGRTWTAGGCECAFHMIGAKVYGTLEGRDFSAIAQERAAKAGFAPQVLGVFDVPSSRNIGEQWGYFTEVITPSSSVDAKIKPLTQAEVKGLAQQFKKLFGERWRDQHAGNHGRHKNGTPMIIDFGELSFPKDGE